MAPSWVAKHQDYIPSVFISFFDFGTDPITNSLHDNQLKTEYVILWYRCWTVRVPRIC